MPVRSTMPPYVEAPSVSNWGTPKLDRCRMRERCQIRVPWGID